MSVNEMQYIIRRDIINFLVQLAVIKEPSSRVTFLEDVALDIEFRQQIKTGGSPKNFCDHFYELADEYGRLKDGRDPMVAVLEAAKEYVETNQILEIQNLLSRRKIVIDKPSIKQNSTINMTAQPTSSTINQLSLPVKGKIDFAIITIREDEFEAVLKRFAPEPEYFGDRRYIISRVELKENDFYQVALARSPEQGEGSAQDLARDMIEELDPEWLLVIGIAGGVPDDEFTLGDVIIGKRLLDFSVKAISDVKPPEYDVRGWAHPLVEQICAALPSMRNKLEGEWNNPESIGIKCPEVELNKDNNYYGDDEWRQKLRASLERHFLAPRPPRFTTAVIAATEELVKSPTLVQLWLQDARSLRAVEMELAGVYQAARRLKRQYPVLAIRGISDIIGFKRDPDWTTYACHSAAAFAYTLLKSGFIKPSKISQIERSSEELQSNYFKLEQLSSDNGIINYSETEEPFLSFANRESELDRIVTYPDEGSYYLIEAPAGYGKTRLLLEINKRFTSSERNWLCAYIRLPEFNSIDEIAETIVRSFGLETKQRNYERPYLAGYKLGNEVASFRTHKQSQGCCLLLDIDKEPFEYLIPLAITFIDEFVKGIFDGLTESTNSFFKEKSKRFKLIVAGRYLNSYVKPKISNWKFSIIQLKPFDYEVVRQICSTLVHPDETRCDDISSHLLFFSGGHPGCMAKILFTIQKHKPKNIRNFFYEHWRDIEIIAGQKGAEVRASITPALRETFDLLSLYPRFDFEILNTLISTDDIHKNENEDAYDLAMRLMRSYLIDWADDNRRHFNDSITRRLLTINMRHNHPNKFLQLCEGVYKNYGDRMGIQDELRFQWAVETLSAFLQIKTNQIQERKIRQELKKKFFEEVLPDVLNKLVDGRDRRIERESFLLAAEMHPDFRFMLNYFLREDFYEDTPYQTFNRNAEQFFANN